jgi:hypothetical protein
MGRWSIEEHSRSVCILVAAAGALFSPLLFAMPASSVALNSSSNPSAYGQAVTLTAMLTPSSATGQVSFFDGATPLGIAALSSGAATLTVRSLAAGSHSLWAYYPGGSSFGAGKSATISQTVRAQAQSGFNWTAVMAADINPVALAT